MHHYVSLGDNALYRFPSKTHFLDFCKAREAAEDEDRDHVRPSTFGGEIMGQVWIMDGADQERWTHMRMIAEVLL